MGNCKLHYIKGKEKSIKILYSALPFIFLENEDLAIIQPTFSFIY